MGPASEGLVFVRPLDGQTDLFRARLSDGAVVRWTATPGRSETWPAWSDAARRVAFLVRPEDGSEAAGLAVRAADGRETRLAPAGLRVEAFPAWIPGRAELVYTFLDPGGTGGVARRALDADAEEVVASRSRSAGAFLRPIPRPGGDAFVVERPHPRGGDLWLLRAGAAPRRLTRTPGVRDERAFFTRTGDAVVFTRGPAGGGPRALWIVEPDGGVPRPLLAHEGADVHQGRPSPTRDELAFVSTRDGAHDVFLAALDGAEPRNLTRTPERSEGAPRWSPDGERLAVVYGPPGVGVEELELATTRIAILDREGRVLLDTPGAMVEWMPAW